MTYSEIASELHNRGATALASQVELLAGPSMRRWTEDEAEEADSDDADAWYNVVPDNGSPKWPIKSSPMRPVAGAKLWRYCAWSAHETGPMSDDEDHKAQYTYVLFPAFGLYCFEGAMPKPWTIDTLQQSQFGDPTDWKLERPTADMKRWVQAVAKWLKSRAHDQLSGPQNPSDAVRKLIYKYHKDAAGHSDLAKELEKLSDARDKEEWVQRIPDAQPRRVWRYFQWVADGYTYAAFNNFGIFCFEGAVKKPWTQKKLHPDQFASYSEWRKAVIAWLTAVAYDKLSGPRLMSPKLRKLVFDYHNS